MRTIKSPNLSLLRLVFGWKGHDYLSLSVLAGFTLDAKTEILEEADMWDRTLASLGQNRILDLSMPKPRGEALVLGKCFAPGNSQVYGAGVYFRVGELEKHLEVFGDRYFRSYAFGSFRLIRPKPFSEMEICWENAFGGPGYELNPVGKGLVPIKTEEGDKLIALPNIEDPDHLVASVDDRPKPAGFGPLGLDWPGRLHNLGTFDRKWLLDHWPGLPEDFDFEYFNLAPEDQRLKGYFRGDEVVLIRGMHPEVHEIMTHLPAIKCRLFVNHRHEAMEEFKEVQTHLDTVYLMPHLEMGLLIWHGLTRVADDEALDVSHLVAFYEPLKGEPEPLEYYRQKMAEPPEEEPEEVEAIVPPAPEAEEEEEPPLEKPPAEVMSTLAAIEEEAAQNELELEKLIKDSGFGPEGLDAPEEFMPPLDQVPKEIPPVDLSPEDQLAEIEKSTQKADAELAQLFHDMGIDPDQPVLEVPAAPEEPRFQNADEFVAHYREQGLEDPEILDHMKKMYEEHEAAAADLAAMESTIEATAEPEKPVQPSPEKPSEPSELEPMTREQVLAGHAVGKSFAGLDLSGLDLSDCDLLEIDLKEAILEKVNFSRSNLSRAKLEGAVLTEADLTESILVRVSGTGVSAAGAVFTGADLNGADLKESLLIGANLAQARLVEADLSDSQFEEADLTEAHCSWMKAPRASFENADLRGAVFIEADLQDAEMNGASLDQANFTRARAQGLRLIGARGQKAFFEGADLQKSRAGDQASFNGGRFARANLNEASWEDTDLNKADFFRASLRKAHMNRCRFVGADLRAADAQGADLSKNDFTGARMTGLDLLGGSLRKSRLHNSDLKLANLYAVDFYKAALGQTDFRGANLDRTLLKVFETSS